MKILVVDDEIELTGVLTITLENAGYEVVTANDADTAFREWQKSQPDLILLDISMPRRSGLDFLEQVRGASVVPIIMLTARIADEDVVRAFDLGADDYVTKPFSPRQLLARIRAALKRTGAQERPEVRVGCVRLDLVHHEAQIGEAPPIHLTPLELKLLQVLMSAPGVPMTPRLLVEQVWGYEGGLHDHSLLKTLVKRVRRKIEPDPGAPRYLKTFTGVGYVFAVDPR